MTREEWYQEWLSHMGEQVEPPATHFTRCHLRGWAFARDNHYQGRWCLLKGHMLVEGASCRLALKGSGIAGWYNLGFRAGPSWHNWRGDWPGQHTRPHHYPLACSSCQLYRLDQVRPIIMQRVAGRWKGRRRKGDFRANPADLQRWLDYVVPTWTGLSDPLIAADYLDERGGKDKEANAEMIRLVVAFLAKKEKESNA